jgi:FkbM family methyltransferase
MPVLSGPLRGARWIAGAHTHGCWVGTYERNRQDSFVRLAKPGMVVYDIGANAGFFTLLASRLVGAGGAVIAMEPLERNLVFLRGHVQANHSRNVTIVAAAASNRVGWTTMTAPSSATARMGAGEIKVATTTLDAMVYQDHRPLPGLVKIDVEGAEMDVLEGGRRVLTQARPAILLSTHSRELRSRCHALLRDAGYVLASETPGVDVRTSDEVVARWGA